MFKNSKKQGDYGVGEAICYFTGIGATVLIPISDSQDYDLVVDDGILKRIQVKTTTFKEPSGNYNFSLVVSGGNRSGTGKRKKPTEIDYYFLVCPHGNYLIPYKELEGRSTITTCDKYKKFKL